MKVSVLVSAVLLVCAAQGAIAACSDTQVTDVTNPTLTVLLTGNTVCVSNGSGWQSQEQHRTGEQL